MSNILALDTSTDACSVALLRQGNVTTIFEMAAKSHTQRLLPMVDEVLQQAGCAKGELDAIAFGQGPGSFTGLRICLGVVQGLAFGLQLPVIPVSTLAAMAAGYYRQNDTISKPLLVALDARMEEVYWGLFERDAGAAVPVALSDEFVMSPAEVLQQSVIQGLTAEQLIGVGPGWHYTALQACQTAAVQQDVYPQAEDIARIAQVLYGRGETLTASEAQPVYLRDQVSWKKRQRIRSESI